MEEREQKGGGAGCIVMGVIAFLVPILYVVGLGPAYWLANKVPATNDFLRNCYEPLGWVGERFEPLDRFLHWYMHLWA
jgi:hypothetical protein